MIWTDASFAIEWLGATKRAAAVGVARSLPLRILPLQYAELGTYFFRRNTDFSVSMLDGFELVHADAGELLAGAFLYVVARAAGSKASLADAILAAVVRGRGGVLYAFDEDFRHLGLQKESVGRWIRA